MTHAFRVTAIAVDQVAIITGLIAIFASLDIGSVNTVSTNGDGTVIGAGVAGFLISVVTFLGTFSLSIATARVHAFALSANLALNANIIATLVACID